jgi:hypothetical protein
MQMPIPFSRRKKPEISLAYNGVFRNDYTLRAMLEYGDGSKKPHDVTVSPFDITRIGDCDLDNLMGRAMYCPGQFFPVPDNARLTRLHF